MNKVLFFIGLAGFVLSLGVFVVSLLLPMINGPRTSWQEAMIGIIPGAFCSLIFFILGVVGLILMLTAQPVVPRRPRDGDEDEEERPRRRRPAQ